MQSQGQSYVDVLKNTKIDDKKNYKISNYI